MTINLRQLRYYTKTIELGSITRAAEQLLVAQPALGLQIRQLERELGVPLLIRHSRGISATAAGQQLYDRALQILSLVEETRAEVIAKSRGERETVVLGMTNGTTALVGHELLREAPERLPAIQLSLVEDMSVVLVDALERAEVDIALAYDVPERPGLLRVPLLIEEVVYVSAPDEAGGEGPITFADMLARPLVLPNERDVIRSRIQTIADQLALPLRLSFEVSSIAMLKRLVRDGGVASVMPYASVVDDVTQGKLVARRIVDPIPRRTLYLIRPMRRARFPADEDLLQFLQDAVRKFLSEVGELALALPALDDSLSAVVSKLMDETNQIG